MGTKILNCPCFNNGICFENSLIMRKCHNYDLCLIKQVLNRTKEQSVISLFEMEEAEDV